MKIKTVAKNVLPKGIINFYRRIKRLPDVILATYYLKRNIKRNHSKNIIKVGFCAEFPAVWDKISPVFELMRKDNRFKVLLVFTRTLNTRNEEEFLNVQQFFNELYPEVEYLINDGNISLSDYNLDYFFYQRPYNGVYPANLKVEMVRKFAKICYIPYGYSGSNAFIDLATDKSFFRNVYFGFIEIKEELQILRRQFNRNIERGYQFFEKLGYPSFEKYLNFEKKDFQGKVLWTPRWTTDDKVGGSHFFDYKDDFLMAARNIAFIFRPHPLMFDNFVKKGMMSEEDVIEYKTSLKDRGVKFSEGEQIEKDFMNTDILLTDYSSIIVEYFLTGKPIIYCKANYQMNEEYDNIMKGIYIANSWNEVMQYLGDLLKGVDPLKDERQRIIKEHFGDVKGAAKRIVERIVDDFNFSR